MVEVRTSLMFYQAPGDTCDIATLVDCHLARTMIHDDFEKIVVCELQGVDSRFVAGTELLGLMNHLVAESLGRPFRTP